MTRWLIIVALSFAVTNVGIAAVGAVQVLADRIRDRRTP